MEDLKSGTSVTFRDFDFTFAQELVLNIFLTEQPIIIAKKYAKLLR